MQGALIIKAAFKMPRWIQDAVAMSEWSIDICQASTEIAAFGRVFLILRADWIMSRGTTGAKEILWLNTLRFPSGEKLLFRDISYEPGEVGHLPAVAQACGVRLWFPIGVEEIVRRIPVVVSAHAADLTLVLAEEGHFHLVVSVKLDSQPKIRRNHCVEATGKDLHTPYWGGGDDDWLPIDLERGSGITLGDSGATVLFRTPTTKHSCPSAAAAPPTVTLPPFPRVTRMPKTSM